jgi:hypothetical protein
LTVSTGSLTLAFSQLDAIYNVCEWHMVDPAQQFRKYLQWDGESAWVCCDRFTRS